MEDPHLFRSAIVKTNAWCNLNCSYCYMFNLGDKTHEAVPRDISRDVCKSIATRIAAYTQKHGIDDFRVVLHGGEPSILPVARFRYLAETLRRQCGSRISLAVQTNGYHMKPAFLEVCAQNAIAIGVSLDGPRAFHDRYRMNHAGRGSHDRILANVSALCQSAHARLFGGFLCVVNPDIPVADFWRWLQSLPRPNINLLWPIEYNHANPHPAPEAVGMWMLALFRLWFSNDDPDIKIPLFNEVIGHALGSRAHSDQMVNDTLNMLVINTDGRIEYPDYFRDKGDDHMASGANVGSHSLDQVARDPVFAALFQLARHLPGACNGCSVQGICGGGFIANRVTQHGSLLDDLSTRSAMCAGHHLFFNGVRDTIAPTLQQAASA